MSVALYMDENVPCQITTGVRLRGIDVLTVQEDSRAGSSDPELLDRAIKISSIHGHPLHISIHLVSTGMNLVVDFCQSTQLS